MRLSELVFETVGNGPNFSVDVDIDVDDIEVELKSGEHVSVQANVTKVTGNSVKGSHSHNAPSDMDYYGYVEFDEITYTLKKYDEGQEEYVPLDKSEVKEESLSKLESHLEEEISDKVISEIDDQNGLDPDRERDERIDRELEEK